MANVTVHQIESKRSESPDWSSFINLEEEYGYVSARGCAHKNKTYLLTDGIYWAIVQFDNEDFENAWMKENLERWSTCFDLINQKYTKKF